MDIQLKPWQEALVRELLTLIPTSVRTPLFSSVKEMTYIDKFSGDGFYHDHIAYISRGIRHPRMLLERTCHEWGHGLETWLSGNGVRIRRAESENFANGFALSILYPELLSIRKWSAVEGAIRSTLVPVDFEGINTEALVERYVRIVKDLAARQENNDDIRVRENLDRLFASQSGGFLRTLSHGR